MTESEATLNDEINNDEQQLIKLCLKKPKKWNWELTTSKSSSNIAFPSIQLYDEKGKTLLAEASEAGFTASSKLRKSASVSKASSMRSSKRKSSLRVQIQRDLIEEIIMNPIITEPEDEKEKSPAPAQDFSEREFLLADARSKEVNNKKSKEKPRTKPYSRSSSNSMRSRSSVSILERISELKRSSSSEDSDTDNENDDTSEKRQSRYSYRTCTLGTIIVPKESFSKVRRRPRKNDDNSGELIFLN